MSPKAGRPFLLLILAIAVGSAAQPWKWMNARAGEPRETVQGKVTVQEFGEAEEALVSLEKDPGFFSQICSLSRINIDHLELFGFSRGEQRVSPASFQKLRKMRAAVLTVMEAEIRRTISTRSTSAPADIRLKNLTRLSSHQLVVLIDLNGAELLETLCEYAKVKRSNPTDQPTTEEQLFSGPPTDSELALLTTIAAILRQEEYAPLLSSDLEKAYCEAVVKAAQQYREPGEDRPQDKPNDWYVFDRHCHEMVHFAPYISVPITDDLRKKIIEWATDYCAHTPQSKRLAAKGMSPWPITR